MHTEDCRRPEKVSILAAAADACRKGLGVAGAAGPEPPPAVGGAARASRCATLHRQASLVLSAVFRGSVPMLRGCFRNAPCSPWGMGQAARGTSLLAFLVRS